MRYRREQDRRVKPQVLHAVMKDVRPHLDDSTVVVSMAAGISVAAIEAGLSRRPFVRIMPNTPCAVGRGLILYVPNDLVKADDLSALLAGFAGVEKPSLKFDQKAKKLTLRYDSMQLAKKNIEMAIAKAGFEANGVTPESVGATKK